MPVQSNTPQGSPVDLAVAAARATGAAGAVVALPAAAAMAAVPLPPAEIGGPKGPEPTRFGDWERAGRCIDF